MKKYQILNTENTRDFAFSLIGMTFEGEIEKEYINLHTCDGDLLFAVDEVKEVEEPKDNNKSITNIIETVKEFKWELKQIWVENNCIFAEVKKPSGSIENEGLYAGSDIDLNDVYKVFSKLRYTLNFNGMLNNDNVLI